MKQTADDGGGESSLGRDGMELLMTFAVALQYQT
jgi:hypothetical protein